MSQQPTIRRRRGKRRKRHAKRPVAAIFERPAAGGAAAMAYPGYVEGGEEDSRRTLVTGSLAALVHLAGFGFLVFLASLAPAIQEQIIPVQILEEEPPPSAEEPAPAPKALAERRPLPFDPAVQAVSPQVVNPQVIAQAAPAVRADALEMDSVQTVTAPTDIQRTRRVVDRVAAVSTDVRARAVDVDVARVAGPVVRGPTRVDARAGPSVGPRRVEAAAVGTTMGTAPMQIGSGNGSSVREGVLSDRDVVGSPDGAFVMAVDTAVGNGLLSGGTPGGTGTAPVSKSTCMQRPEVVAYLEKVRERTIARWVLPPGVEAGRKVTLRFRIDSAGSPSTVSIERAEDNALGASAVDALRAAAPFPSMPDSVRCLARVPIVGTFSNPVGG